MTLSALPATAYLSIGALAHQAGVSVATIRNWERRYGFPSAERLPSGHRRYRVDVIAALERVRGLLDQGLKPVDAIESVKSSANGGMSGASMSVGGLSPDTEKIVEDMLHFALRLDVEQVDGLLDRMWNLHTPLDFIESIATPLLREIGMRWARGEIGVATEHFISERLRDFLSQRWRAVNGKSNLPRVVCACLPGERHVLGLHLAAVAATLSDVHVVFLGADTPIRDILSAVDRVGADAVAVSVAAGASVDLLRHQLRVVRRGLPVEVALWVGGAGVSERQVTQDIARVVGLRDLPMLAANLSARG